MPSRDDPFGEYDHLKPVPLEQAAKEMQIAEAKVDHLKTAINLQQKQLNDLHTRCEEAKREVAEKRYLLELSARHLFIPPTPTA